MATAFIKYSVMLYRSVIVCVSGGLKPVANTHVGVIAWETEGFFHCNHQLESLKSFVFNNYWWFGEYSVLGGWDSMWLKKYIMKCLMNGFFTHKFRVIRSRRINFAGHVAYRMIGETYTMF